MARRDSNPLYVLSLLPWRVSLIAAVSVFVLMRFVAPNFSAADNMLLHGLLNQTAPRLATFFVCLFLLLGVLSFFREQSRARLLASQTGIESIRKLDASSDHFGTTEISEYQKTAGLIDFLGARHLRIGRWVV